MPTKPIASFDAADYVCSVTIAIGYVVQVSWPAADCSRNMGLKKSPNPTRIYEKKVT